MSQTAAAEASTGGLPAGPGGLPDVNAQINPYDVVQHMLDRAATFNIFALPDPEHPDRATLTPNDPQDYFGLNGGYGLDIRSTLHRLATDVRPPSLDAGVRVDQRVGEAGGTLRCRWLFGPPDLQWTPGREPSPAIFDPWRSQRFAVQDGTFTFNDEGDGFSIYGIGRTFPMAVHRRPVLMVAAVGNLMEGKGRLQGMTGTFILTGRIVDLGFRGNITLRALDWNGKLRSDDDLPGLKPVADPAPDDSFLVFRGVKKDSHVQTTFGPPPDARRVALITPSQMRSADFRWTAGGRRKARTRMSVGQVDANMDATVLFDLLAPPGTPQNPVPFETEEEYRFIDSDGRLVGTVRTGVIEGISFNLEFPALPGQPGVRFAGFGPITGGTGAFEGVQGMLTVNSLIGISPHALSLVHCLHILDPERRFRTGD